MIPILPLPPRHAEADVRAFEAVCERLAGFDAGLDPEFVDGFLTAAAAGPRAVELDELLERLPGDALGRAFGDPEALDEARRALRTRLAVLRRQLDAEALLDDPDLLRLEPWMGEWTDEARGRAIAEGHATAGEALALQTGAGWARGFLAAVEAWPTDWQPPDEDAGQALAEGLESVLRLALVPGTAAFEQSLARAAYDAPPDREQLVDDALYAVQDLRVWWIDHAPRPAPRRVDKAPGRNDPCPCGSGRKFKACHGRG